MDTVKCAIHGEQPKGWNKCWVCEEEDERNLPSEQQEIDWNEANDYHNEGDDSYDMEDY